MQSDRATREPSRVALVTCADLPTLDLDDRLLVEPLRRHGIVAEATIWDDPAVDWAGYQLVVLRSCWDYPGRRDEFVAWAASVPRLMNRADVVAWNTDKRYLGDLARVGVPVVPTSWLAPGQTWSPPTEGQFVIKPAIGAGSIETARYDLGNPEHRRLAAEHVARLQGDGRTAMVQPYLPAVQTHGETALMFIDGAYSHAIGKGPMLTGPDPLLDGLYREETISDREATADERTVAEHALAALPHAANLDGPELLYARVDLIPGPDATPLVVELEVAEPSLFLGHSPIAAERLAGAIAAHLPSA